MVTRKPLPANANIDVNAVAPPRLEEMRNDLWSATESENSSDRPWDDEPAKSSGGQGKPDTRIPDDVPESLRPGKPLNYNLDDDRDVWGDSDKGAEHTSTGASESDLVRVPTALRPGGAAHRPETNPFLKVKSSNAPAQDRPMGVLLPIQSDSSVPRPPTDGLARLQVSESSNNPWQPALDGKRGQDADSAQDAWASAKSSRLPTPGPTSHTPTPIPLPAEEDAAGWGDEKRRQEPLQTPLSPTEDEDVMEDAHAWDDLGHVDKGKSSARPPVLPAAGSSPPLDDWNLIDPVSPEDPSSKQDTSENFVDAEEGPATLPPRGDSLGGPPSLPPRRSVEAPPAKPPRPFTGDKTETYQIKNINWHDASASKNPRVTPILVQNANGPCPLVALVNALTLTTSASLPNTGLVEALRSREQVSLELLLSVVIDELIRRTDEDVELPDPTELFSFLQGLHTGMNVNPRFIPTPQVMNAFKRTSLTHLHPTERGDMIPGTFEDAREMELYATFAIPLIHGWLPPRDEPIYEALERRAASYEDAQNLLFCEEELEEKLTSRSDSALTEEEQEIYQDILTIKSFLSISATQLTPWGLEVITKAMRPGSFAILFRNDHFSTLYRHPQTLELLTLVTDAGYAGHAEVVWESLIDINGERAEFFSGDFRVVGGAGQQGIDSSEGASNGDDGWTTVQGRRMRGRPQSESGLDGVPLSPKHEQEDRDLALALQLQEEEDERHRSEQERRRRESMLSEQYIEQQGRPGTAAATAGRGGRGGSRGRGGQPVATGRGGQPVTTGRRSSGSVGIPVTTTSSNSSRGRGSSTGSPVRARVSANGGPRPLQQTVRSLIPRTNRPADEGLDDAPPSYEQAAQDSPYIPPTGHPNHPSSSPDRGNPAARSSSNSLSAGRANGSPAPARAAVPARAAGPASAGPSFTSPAGAVRTRQGIPPPLVTTSSNSGKERECVVM